MRIRLYLDEDVPFAFAQALLNRGIDIITTQQVKNDSLSDAEQLNYVVKVQRTIFTHNKKDFILMGYLLDSSNDYILLYKNRKLAFKTYMLYPLE